jgi:hypothetical protein
MHSRFESNTKISSKDLHLIKNRQKVVPVKPKEFSTCTDAKADSAGPKH